MSDSTAVAAFAAVFLTWEPWAVAAFPGLAPRTQDFENSFLRWALYLSPYAQMPGFICGVLTCQIYLLIRAVPGGRFLVTLIAIVTISALLYQLMERPARRWLHGRWLEHLRDHAAQPALAVGGNPPHA